MTINVPRYSNWTSGAHWHETHTEYLRVTQGAAKVTLGGQTKIFRPSDGIIVIPRYVIHEWSRVHTLEETDFGHEFADNLIVEEWTDPADGLKDIFFRNLNGVFFDETKGGTSHPRSQWWLTLQLWVIFHGLDNWPVLLDGPLWFRWVITHTALRTPVTLGKIWRLTPTYEEYTPDYLKDE